MQTVRQATRIATECNMHATATHVGVYLLKSVDKAEKRPAKRRTVFVFRMWFSMLFIFEHGLIVRCASWLYVSDAALACGPLMLFSALIQPSICACVSASTVNESNIVRWGDSAHLIPFTTHQQADRFARSLILGRRQTCALW